jgi:hypothetical protein
LHYFYITFSVEAPGATGAFIHPSETKDLRLKQTIEHIRQSAFDGDETVNIMITNWISATEAQYLEWEGEALDS